MLTTEQLEELRPHLFAGHYNLLLGSGISLDSTDSKGKQLKSATELTEALCTLKSVRLSTSLARVSGLLDAAEIKHFITDPYSSCRPGETVKRLTSFVWRTAYTFNVDDALESAYESTARAKQKVEPLNYDTLYKTPPNRGILPIVHLHGFTREPEKGYVFSTAEYARVTRGMNPWMHVLSEVLASEPFILAGTSLSESDLEYYLSGRSPATVRANRGPSLLIDPSPDKIIEDICKRHHFVLVRAKLAEFLAWLLSQVGNPPTVAQITIPSLEGLFKKPVAAEEQLTFFNDFELVKPAPPNPEGEVSPFYFDKAPRWSDLETQLDVPTEDERKLTAKARNWISEDSNRTRILASVSEAGSGKTTQLRRAAYELAKEGHLVFSLSAKSAIDDKTLAKVLSAIDRPVTLVIDGLADNVGSLRTALSLTMRAKPLLILGADRDYRREHIDRVLGDLPIEYLKANEWTLSQYETLIEKMRKSGLLGAADAVHNPKRFASKLLHELIAIASCRALNNFRPLEAIVRSLWKDGSEAARRSYAIAALAEFCYPGGIFYPILEKAHPNSSLSDQVTLDCPLPLAYADDDDFIVPLQPAVAERLLHMLSREKSQLLLEIFCALAKAISPYVNRRTTIDKTPEARLAARLFSAEQVVRPLLGDNAQAFFVETKNSYEWNSRYWEQRAILTQTKNLDQAIQYARHAVAIEAHPYPWTTLASLLTRKMETAPTGIELMYAEIYDLLAQVIRHETERSWRRTPHAYGVLFHATNVLLDRGLGLAPKRRDGIADYIDYCLAVFSRDRSLRQSIDQLRVRI